MKKSNGRKPNSLSGPGSNARTRRHLLPALAAVGGACGLAANPALSLELGQVSIDSALGQPLRASIAYALQPQETIAGYCIFLNPVAGANGIPGVGEPRITVTDSAIILTGTQVVREPLLSMQVSVNCPGSARLAREYTLFVDPAPLQPLSQPVLHASADAPASTGQTPAVLAAPASAPASGVRPALRRSPAAQTGAGGAPHDISVGTRYQVQPGDSLSEIVSRIEGRTLGMWPAVDALFAANPDAFLNNDPNLIKAGSWLVIPDMGAQPAMVTAAPAVMPTTEIAGVADLQVADIEATSTAPQPVPVAAAAPLPMTPDTVTVTTELPAGDAEPASATTVATTPSGARTVIVSMPDATGAAAAATGQAAEAPTGHSWLTWLSATGVLAGLAMMLFGHRIRNRFRSNVVTVAVTPAPRRRKADVARGRLAQAAPAAIPQPQPKTAEPKEVRAPKVSVPQGGEPVKIDVELPAASSPTGFELREIPPTSAPATGGYEYAISADLIDHVLEEDDPTARDLQTISEEGGDISRFSMVNDFERQIFAQDYEAAMIATGHFTKGFSEFQKSSDDEQPEPEFKASKAS